MRERESIPGPGLDPWGSSLVEGDDQSDRPNSQGHFGMLQRMNCIIFGFSL